MKRIKNYLIKSLILGMCVIPMLVIAKPPTTPPPRGGGLVPQNPKGGGSGAPGAPKGGGPVRIGPGSIPDIKVGDLPTNPKDVQAVLSSLDLVVGSDMPHWMTMDPTEVFTPDGMRQLVHERLKFSPDYAAVWGPPKPDLNPDLTDLVGHDLLVYIGGMDVQIPKVQINLFPKKSDPDLTDVDLSLGYLTQKGGQFQFNILRDLYIAHRLNVNVSAISQFDLAMFRMVYKVLYLDYIGKNPDLIAAHSKDLMPLFPKMKPAQWNKIYTSILTSYLEADIMYRLYQWWKLATGPTGNGMQIDWATRKMFVEWKKVEAAGGDLRRQILLDMFTQHAFETMFDAVNYPVHFDLGLIEHLIDGEPPPIGVLGNIGNIE